MNFWRMGIKSLGEIRLPYLVRYLAELEKRGFAGPTRKRKTISIRSFVGYLYLDGYIPTNIGKQIIPPNIDVRKPRYLTTEGCSRLLDFSKPNIRDYTIIYLMLQTGISLGELTRLCTEDIEIPAKFGDRLNSGSIRIFGGRGRDSRLLPLCPKICNTRRCEMDGEPIILKDDDITLNTLMTPSTA